jgi:pimeloyl-ACP methyl ester carboxylesterase
LWHPVAVPLASHKLFLPGFGALGSLYAPGVPSDWSVLDLPAFRQGRGSFAARCRWIAAEIDRRPGPVTLAGHSMGAGLAIAGAAARPERIERLLLISPAGLPLAKRMSASLGEFAAQVAHGRYPLRAAARSTRAALGAPSSTLRLARAVHSSNLSREMAVVRAAGIDVTVVGVCTDTLVTPDHCRRAAELLGATYRELIVEGGHMWMLDSWPALARMLDDAA